MNPSEQNLPLQQSIISKLTTQIDSSLLPNQDQAPMVALLSAPPLISALSPDYEAAPIDQTESATTDPSPASPGPTLQQPIARSNPMQTQPKSGISKRKTLLISSKHQLHSALLSSLETRKPTS